MVVRVRRQQLRLEACGSGHVDDSYRGSLNYL